MEEAGWKISKNKRRLKRNKVQDEEEEDEFSLIIRESSTLSEIASKINLKKINKNKYRRGSVANQILYFILNPCGNFNVDFPSCNFIRERIRECIKEKENISIKPSKIFISICSYHILNGCSNERVINLQLPFNGEEIEVSACYQNIDKDRNITFRLHLDFSYKITRKGVEFELYEPKEETESEEEEDFDLSNFVMVNPNKKKKEIPEDAFSHSLLGNKDEVNTEVKKKKNKMSYSNMIKETSILRLSSPPKFNFFKEDNSKEVSAEEIREIEKELEELNEGCSVNEQVGNESVVNEPNDLPNFVEELVEPELKEFKVIKVNPSINKEQKLLKRYKIVESSNEEEKQKKEYLDELIDTIDISKVEHSSIKEDIKNDINTYGEEYREDILKARFKQYDDCIRQKNMLIHHLVQSVDEYRMSNLTMLYTIQKLEKEILYLKQKIVSFEMEEDGYTYVSEKSLQEEQNIEEPSNPEDYSNFELDN